ncbi:hypothetical protein GGTG_01745 [Gaeumannomyces tritici R3-111a-1]|uniref:Uncharacterized protein n=1 Tax=Gaeumannomyces tritici (strain R3-111a-1) TaxID=644352 RepID=J3NKF6_GAET3|nr:hypothetical protein GGTG_01745 [Gaeumannomyces tritici R3-111a-1]EJT81770.1 hypothetical protein GGTG_01745 [Gaeumannomyces tritici R3-111a-1]
MAVMDKQNPPNCGGEEDASDGGLTFLRFVCPEEQLVCPGVRTLEGFRRVVSSAW